MELKLDNPLLEAMLTTEHKQRQVHQEIIASGESVDIGLGAGGIGEEFVDGSCAGAGAGLGVSSVKINIVVSTAGLYEEVKTNTIVKPSIIRSSVLPTINSDVKILKQFSMVLKLYKQLMKKVLNLELMLEKLWVLDLI